MIFGLLLGVGLPGGVQVGFASLVDLETGDLRTLEPAKKTVENLLSGFPL